MPKSAKKKPTQKKPAKKQPARSKRVGIDAIGASKDGHQFHEAWLARRSLELIFSRDGLCGITVEGLSKDIEDGAPTEAIEIADATFFYGEQPTFAKATRIDVTQFKYSVARDQAPMRFSDAKKTIKKFATADAGFTRKHGAAPTRAKFLYTLFTNRPISDDLADALAAARSGSKPRSKGAKEQHKQLCGAIPFKGKSLSEFLKRLELVGGSVNLATVEGGTAKIIADWSASTDLMARARIGDLRKLVRDKNGAEGQRNKLIVKVDVLAALLLDHEDDLLPTPDAFPAVGEVVERVQLTGFLAAVGSHGRWLVHAEGGIGKTVFVQSLAAQLGLTDEVVLFDCFGGGAYRSTIDERHRPERGLMHIVNELACRGLCDPILPRSSEPSEVIRRAITRFTQALAALRRTRPAARLIIIMDAADNAADEAKKRSQPSFPKELLESLTHHPPIDGLIVIATARPERRELAIGTAECTPFAIEPFTSEETTTFVLARRPKATPAQISALRSRSDGNPRVLASLIEPDRPLAGENESTEKVLLDSLIEDRIERAIKLADTKGAKSGAIDSFLCALAVLPPPVPVDEMALAFGLLKEEASSLAADLAPLLERTKHGLIFRDEPTETLVKSKYASKLNLMETVVSRLTDAQDTSVYAARALPMLLSAMDRVDDLRKLAFDTRFPPELDSEVPKRAIRLVRVKMALGAAAKVRDFDATTDLLVELSALALVNQRGDRYLANNPDLVVGLADPESLRRLFEMKLGWVGERHSRLAIAYTLDRDLGAAYGHAVRAEEWIRWSYNQDDGTMRTHRADESEHVAIPFYLTVDGRQEVAARYVGQFDTDFGYKLAGRLFSLLGMADTLGKYPEWPATLERFVRSKEAPPALLSAVLSYVGSDAEATLVLRQLAARQEKPTDPQAYVPREDDSFRASLLRCALRACALGLGPEAKAILEQASPRRYDFWGLSDPWPTNYVLPWTLAAAVQATLDERDLTLFDCLPAQLWRVVEDLDVPKDVEAQDKLLFEALKVDPPYEGREPKREGAAPSKSQLSSSDRHRVSDRVKDRVLPVLRLGHRVVCLLKARTPVDKKAATIAFFASWREAQDAVKASAWSRQEQQRFLDELHSTCALHLLPSIAVLDQSTAALLEQCVEQAGSIYAHVRIRFVELLSANPECHAFAGRAATAALKVIGLEDEVQQRAGLFARLARALLPANKVEAGFLFKRGLTQLDAIGSGDHDFMNELLGFAASVQDGPINPAAALRLAKICELNNYDSHKFPWPLAGKAFSRIWGTKYLAQIARWHDRDKVDLELTLPAALSFLLRDRVLPPADCVLLLGLTEPVGMWDWGWRDLFDSLLTTTTDVALFNEVLNQLEHAFPTGSYGRYLREIREVLQKHPEVSSALSPRLNMLEAEEKARRQVDRTSRSTPLDAEHVAESVRRQQKGQAEIEAAIAATDPLDVAALEALVETLEKQERALDAKVVAFKALWPRIAYADREKHIEAIALARNLELFSKNELLKVTKEAWQADSPSALASIDSLAKRLVSAHAEQLMSADWGFNWELSKLAELTRASRTDLAIDLVTEAITRDLEAAATTWLNLASLTAAAADPAVPKAALERLLDDAAGRLADEVGDGVWRNELDPGDDQEEVVAGLIWFCLGSPEALSRWRAAHVVRACARNGRWPLIAKLFSKLGTAGAGAFQDQEIPFMALHAKFWFLLAIARIALDSPKDVAVFVDPLEAIALNDSFPHVGLRQVAATILKTCLGNSADSEAKAILKRIASVHVSKYPKPEKTQHVPGKLWHRPEDMSKPEPHFHFDYDFEKYKVAGLGRLFGLPQWQTGDRCISWIRRLSPTATSMYDYAGRRKPHDDYREGTKDQFHSYGMYLAWHALALTAGELFLERPVARVESYEDSWDDFLSNYRVTRRDGLWLSDGTDRYPARARDELILAADKERSPTDDEDMLLKLAGIYDERRLRADFIASGSWSSPDHIRVEISTALVPADKADRAAVAVGTSPEFHMYLPTAQAYENEDGDEDDNCRHRDSAPCIEWISRREAYAKLDEYDLFGSRASIQRDRLTMAFNKEYGLVSNDPWWATWRDPGDEIVYTAEAWGVHRGEGKGARAEEGDAVTCRTGFLLEVLKRTGCDLLMLIKLELFIERSRYSEDEGESKFVHSWVTAIIDQKGMVTLIKPTDSDREIVDSLPHEAKYSLSKRFAALAKRTDHW
ncbi:AAA ATPase [Bradyrhizobium oligotrophicum S58]|uniref:AAA ATPase n=1 Tax=Bradyrhizobium oligotrophicum S58 TaxID=1245469 RepID=M4Z8G5_9BRAD|nr:MULTISPECIES: NACHT domain-containing protein [Bradyrhizobium]BAM89476.1 AAA ATPase [Bradyrhizobium oligotrophicum S58]